jgi:RNA 3'-phosphate cyclase
MIEIDGSQGEGGGQMLRTSVALSALKGEPVRIFNIRAGRDRPGLRPQHLKAVEAVGLLCDAVVEGSSVGSGEVSFAPGKIKAGTLRVDVGTAGSATLVLQALLPVALNAPGDVSVDVFGGTDVSHSPSADYFNRVFCHIISKMGCEIDVEAPQRGFYPKGGGMIRAAVRPWKYARALALSDAGRLEAIDVYSTATEHLRRQEVAERQVKGFLKKASPQHQVGEIVRNYVESPSIGSSFFACARYENTRLGVCVLGERGLKAEDVGANAAKDLLAEMEAGAPLDAHMADQIIPYLVLAGGEARTAKLTEHAKTNIEVAGKFGYDITVEDNVISAGRH